MADKIKAIKIKQKNGTYSEEVPISVNVQNVQWDENNHTLLDALGSVDISSSGKGNLQHQIDELDGDKISTNQFNSRLNDFLKDQISADTTDWLDDNVNPVGSAVIVDKTLTIEGAAADALAVKTELNKKANASNTYTKAEVNAAIDAKQIEVDDTLSITGTAADAKAVGDELTAVKADLNALDSKVDVVENVLDDVGSVFKQGLNGHTWSVLGDSISDNNSTIARGVKYYNHIKDRNPNLSLYLHAISGQRMTEIARRYQTIHYSDIITIFAGVNDWGRSTPTPLGDINDTDDTTFYGALDILCNGILTHFPKSLLIFITPTGNNGYSGVPSDTNRLGLTIEDYGTAIINVCRKYQVPVLDLYHISMLNPQIPEIKEEYFVDGIHYNSKGHNVASYLIENEMLRHYIPFVNAVDGGRLLTVDDIESHLGIDNIYVTNGNLTYTNARDNFIIRFKSYVKRIKFTYVPLDPTYSTAFLWQCFNYDNDNNIYCTGGDINFLFHRGADRYTSTTRVDDFSSVIRYQNSQYILDNIEERAEIYIEDRTLHITLNNEEVVSLTNARILGFWGSSTRGFRLDNVIIYED